MKDVYSYEEGDSGAEVCLEGSGETAQPVTVDVSSYVEGTATGTYTECTFICAMCQKRGGNRCWCLISVLINLSSLYNWRAGASQPSRTTGTIFLYTVKPLMLASIIVSVFFIKGHISVH